VKSRFSNWVSPLIVAAGILMLLVLAVFIVNRENATSVASAAEASIVAENSLGVVSSVRTATVYALTLSMASGTSEGLADSLVDIEAASLEFKARAERLATGLDGDISGVVASQADSFSAKTEMAIEAIRAEDYEAAALHVDDQAVALARVTETLVGIRDENIEDVLVAGKDVGRAAEAVRFLILFFIPLAVIVAFWRTQRRHAEKRLLAKEVEKQRQIAQSKDEFIADVSHELRTPLTGIYGFAVALEENANDPTELESELMGLIINESAELARMVDDLVAIGRIDAGAVSYSLGLVDVATEIEEVMKPFERMGITFEYESAGLTVFADRVRFRQILRNLLSNAVKYGDGEIAVAVRAQNDSTLIEVIDNGPGVPADVASRLFERYVHSGGTALLEGSIGLGLAIAQSFAEGMGGDLSYSRPDGLTVFQIQLPTGTLKMSEDLRALATTTT
jgi:signal transduction histidine kinase